MTPLPARLEINTSGSWALLCIFDMNDKTATNVILRTVERLLLVLHAHATPRRKGVLRVRVVPADPRVRGRMGYSLEKRWEVTAERA